MSAQYPDGIDIEESQKVIFITFKELCQHNFKGKQDDYIVLVDEFDHLIDSKFCYFCVTKTKSERDDDYQLVHMPSFLSKFYGVFGISATISSVTTSKMKLNKKDHLFVFEVDPK